MSSNLDRGLLLPLCGGALLVGALGLGMPATAAAQAVLRTGVAAQGELKAGDLKLDDDTYADLWRFTGTRGQSIRVTMRAPDFDSYLQLGFYSDKGEWVSVDSDDDGAGGTDSQIDLVLPRDGEFTVRANTLMVGETGPYSLVLETGVTSTPPASGPASGSSGALVSSTPGAHMPLVLGAWLRGTLGPGDEVLSDGSPADIWVYQGRRGETLTMIQKSDVLDSYLTFGSVLGGQWKWEKADNNGAGGKDARLVTTLDADGEVWIRPNALFAGKGDYTLYVTSDRAATGGPAPSPASSSQPAIGSVGPLQQGLASSTPAASSGAPASPASPASADAAEIQLGQTIRGRLGPGDRLSFDTTYIDTYVYRGHSGDRLSIIMISPDFGSYLLFGKAPAGGSTFSSMEHTGATAGREAKITVTVPEDGTYWIQANQFNRSDGAYLLTLEPAR